MIVDIFTGILLIIILVIASGVAVDVFEKIAYEMKVNKLMLATLLVAISTSLPELFVGIAGALNGQSQIGLGNIIGANLANLSWIIGGAALVFGSIPVVGDYLKNELWITVGMAMIPFLMLGDGMLTRWDGLMLIFLYFVYAYMVVKGGNGKIKHLKLSGRKKVAHHLKTKMEWLAHMIVLVLALVILAASSWMLIDLVQRLSFSLNVSLFWIGMMVLAIGTTLPELVLSIVASEKKEISLVLGNVLGSVVVNSTLILGIIAVINPIAYADRLQRGVAGVFLVTILGLFWLFTKSKHKLERWEGAVLVGVFAMFVGIQMMLA